MESRGREKKGFHRAASLPSCLLNQTSWLVLVLPSPFAPPSSSGNPVLCEFPVCLVEDLPVLTPRRHVEEEKDKGTREWNGGEAGGWKAKGKTLDTLELGLIYFINRDYKFNLQTRGQNFSLTRGPWRTPGLGDHSYY